MPYVQFGIWLHAQLNPGTASYNNAVAARIRGPLDIAALQSALQQIQDRHAPLRSRYEEDDEGSCWAVVDPPGTRGLQCEVMEAPRGIQAPEVEEALSKHATQPFDLTAGPVWRVLVTRFDADDHLLAITQHHIVSDGGSLRILLGELATLYAAEVEGGPSLDKPISDYFSVVQKRESQSDPKSLGFWQQQLKGAGDGEYLRKAAQMSMEADSGDVGPGVVTVDVAGDTTRAFRAQCVDRRASIFAGLISMFIGVLRTFADEDDVVLTTPVDIRGKEGAGLIGCFTNTVPLRVHVELTDTLDDILSHVSHTLVAAIENATVPYAQIIAGVESGRRGGNNPFSEIAVVDKNAPGGAVRFAGLDLAPHILPAQHIRHHIALSIGQRGDQLAADFEYGPKISRDTVEAIATRWHEVLKQISEPGCTAWNVAIADAVASSAAEEADHV